MKNYQRKDTLLRLAFIALIVFVFAQMTATAQTTAFNFQGRLNDGSSPANGRYDLQFLLYDALVGGNQVGPIVTKNNQQLINGIFSTQLDFGATAFSGGNRFLEIQLRPTGAAGVAPNVFVILGARQQLLSVPYTVRSLNATNADSATNATNAQTSTNSLNLGGTPAANYVKTDANGNVGIGGNAPAAYKLFVAGNGAINGNAFVGGDTTINGKTEIGGNLLQPLASKGVPKAIVRLDRDGGITNCYNGVTGASTGNCGFSVTHSVIGQYNINFGFDIQSRALTAISEFDESQTIAFIIGRGPTTLSVWVSYIFGSNASNLTNSPVNVVVY